MANEHESSEPKKKIGRPEGSMNKLAREAREKALATGKLPHEILLSMARGEPQPNPIVDKDTGRVTGRTYIVADLEQRKDAAKAAAPYYAPRIQAVEVMHGVSDANLNSLIAQLLTETGITLSPDGEGEAAESNASTGRRVWSDDDDDTEDEG